MNVYVVKPEYDKELNLEASELCSISSQNHITDKLKFKTIIEFYLGSQISLRGLSLNLASSSNSNISCFYVKSVIH